MKYCRHLNLLFAALLLAPAVHAGSLTIESWRTEDIVEWNQLILPEFQKQYPDIQISFKPTVNVDYDNALKSRLSKGTAGDLISCRPFSEHLFQDGYLEKVNDIDGLRNYRSIAKLAWTTDDGLNLFCVPMASVMHGFFYNKRIFAKLGIDVPETEAEFFAALQKIKRSKIATPIALGTKDAWVTNQVIFTGIGPNRWNGEDGRTALLEGKQKFTDSPFVNTWRTMASWADYMPRDYKKISNDQAREMFAQGKAAIFPGGSWEIDYLSQHSKDELGVFRPPVLKAGDNCYLSNHIDIGIGINNASTNKADAEKFAQWVTTRPFANILANSLPGFFPLTSHQVEIREPLAREMMSWRRICDTTIRVNSYALNRGDRGIELDLWRVSTQVMNRTLSPKAAAAEIQKILDSWYVPISSEGGSK